MWRGTTPHFPLQSQCSVAAYPVPKAAPPPPMSLLLHSGQIVMVSPGYVQEFVGGRVVTLLTVGQ